MQVGGWRGCRKKDRGLEDGGAERRGSPDTPIPQERTSRLGVTVMGRGHNEDTSLQQWGALSQTHTPTGRQTQVNTLRLCTHIPTGPHTHQITIKPLSWSCQRTSNKPQRHCETRPARCDWCQLSVTVGIDFFLLQGLFDDSLGKKGQNFFLSPFSHRRCRAVKRPACSKIKWGVERIGLICKAIGCREGRKIITLRHKTKWLLNHFKQYRTMWRALWAHNKKRKSSHGESSWTTKWNLISWSSSQCWVRLLGDLGGWAHPSTINKVTLGHYVAITWALSDNVHQKSGGEQPPLIAACAYFFLCAGGNNITCSPVWHSSMSYIRLILVMKLSSWSVPSLSFTLTGCWTKTLAALILKRTHFYLYWCDGGLMKEWELHGVHMDLCISTSNEDVESCRSGKEKTRAGKWPGSTRGARVWLVSLYKSIC